jgi:hypothetical protein
MIAFEEYIDERIEAIKKKISEIVNGNYKTIDELELFLKIVISGYYKIPIFSDFFEKRTLNELLIEAEVIRIRGVSEEESVQEIVKESTKDLTEDDYKDMFSMFDDEMSGNIGNLNQQSNDFLNNGKFIGEE